MAAPTYRSAGTGGTTTTTSTTVTKPAGTVSGDLLIALVTNGSAGSAPSTVPSGWTLAASSSISTTLWAGVYTLIAGGSEPANYTWSGFTDSCAGSMICVSGADTTTPVAAFRAQANTNAHPACNSITAPVADCLIVAGVGTDDNQLITDASWACATNPTSLTERTDLLSSGGVDTASALATAPQTVTGATGNFTATLAGTRDNISFLLAIQPPSGGTNASATAATGTGTANNATATASGSSSAFAGVATGTGAVEKAFAGRIYETFEQFPTTIWGQSTTHGLWFVELVDTDGQIEVRDEPGEGHVLDVQADDSLGFAGSLVVSVPTTSGDLGYRVRMRTLEQLEVSALPEEVARFVWNYSEPGVGRAYYYVALNTNGIQLGKIDTAIGLNRILATDATSHVVATWYDVHVRQEGTNLRVWVNGTLRANFTDGPGSGGTPSWGTSGETVLTSGAIGMTEGNARAQFGQIDWAYPTGYASGTGTAYNATVSTSTGGTSASAGAAAGTGTAYAAAVAVKPPAGLASGTGTANNVTATTSVIAAATAAAGAGVAANAAVAVSSSAATATGTGSANNAAATTATIAAATAATGAGTANNASTSVFPVAAAASGAGTANNAATAVSAPAGHASGTATANNAAAATGTVAVATAASGTGAAHGPAAQVAPSSSAAAGVGAAYGATVVVAMTAGAATGTGSGLAPATSVAPHAGVASGTGTANDASVPVGGTGSAGAAEGTGTAGNASVTAAPSAGSAAGSGAAHGPASRIDSAALPAAGAGAAANGAARVAPTAGGASASGAAFDATVLSGVVAAAGFATGTGTANAAAASVQARAEAASGAGGAYGPGSSVAPHAEAAAGSGSAGSPSGSVGASAGAGTGSGSAGDCGKSVASNAQAAAGTGAANDTTVTTSAATNAQATAASGSGTAYGPATRLSPSADGASGTGTANNATVTTATSGTALASAASGTGTAHDATVTAVDGPTPTPGPTGSGWYGLLDIIHEAREEALAEAAAGWVACPNDGEPLAAGPDGQLFCAFDGWRPDGSYVAEPVSVPSSGVGSWADDYADDPWF